MDARSRCLSRRISDETGQALVLAMVIVLVGVLLTLATVTFAVGGLDVSKTDRSTEGSVHSADAGIDLALWRTNKLLVSNQVDDLLGFVDGVVQTLGCASVGVGGGQVLSLGLPSGVTAPTSGTTTPAGTVSWCPGAAEINGDATTSTFEYWQSTAIDVLSTNNTSGSYTYPSAGTATLNRAVVSVGSVGGALTRLLAVFTLCPGGETSSSSGGIGNCSGSSGTTTNASGALTSLWGETYYVRCPAPPSDYASSATFAREPDAGCPFTPAPATPTNW